MPAGPGILRSGDGACDACVEGGLLGGVAGWFGLVLSRILFAGEAIGGSSSSSLKSHKSSSCILFSWN